jgi:hypothetical protein
LRAEGDEGAAVPFDDGLESLDNEEGMDGWVFESREGGVAQTEAAYDDIEAGSFETGETESGEFFLDHVEEAGHEEGVAEFDFEDLETVQGADAAAAQCQGAERGGAVIEFGEVGGHEGGEAKG